MEKTNFGSIKLSDNSVLTSIATHCKLEKHGFKSIGVMKSTLGVDCFNYKSKELASKRSTSEIKPKEFLMVFLDYCGECHILGKSPKIEQAIYKITKELDKKATINIGL